jgi:hypothetical protein
MLKKLFSYLLILFSLQLFLSQSVALLITHLTDNEISDISLFSNNDCISEFNISTHTNTLFADKDESNEEESNLEILSSIAFYVLNSFSLFEKESANSNFFLNNTSKSYLPPFYILNRVIRL